MAAYRRVDDLTVTCRLTACTPGSVPGPTLGIEYGKPLPLPFLHSHNTLRAYNYNFFSLFTTVEYLPVSVTSCVLRSHLKCRFKQSHDNYFCSSSVVTPGNPEVRPTTRSDGPHKHCQRPPTVQTDHTYRWKDNS